MHKILATPPANCGFVVLDTAPCSPVKPLPNPMTQVIENAIIKNIQEPNRIK